MLLGMFCLIIAHIGVNEVVWIAQAKPTSEITQSLGYSGLSLSSDCLSSRNPILEPTCLTDLPGGYCYHWSCGMVGTNTAGQQYHLEVLHP
jgi:hypothetical protein